MKVQGNQLYRLSVRTFYKEKINYLQKRKIAFFIKNLLISFAEKCHSHFNFNLKCYDL